MRVHSAHGFYVGCNTERLDVAGCRVLWNLYLQIWNLCFVTNLQVHGIVTFANDMETNCMVPSYFDTWPAQNQTDRDSCTVDESHRIAMLAVAVDLVIQMMASGRYLVSL